MAGIRLLRPERLACRTHTKEISHVPVVMAHRCSATFSAIAVRPRHPSIELSTGYCSKQMDPAAEFRPCSHSTFTPCRTELAQLAQGPLRGRKYRVGFLLLLEAIPDLSRRWMRDAEAISEKMALTRDCRACRSRSDRAAISFLVKFHMCPPALRHTLRAQIARILGKCS